MTNQRQSDKDYERVKAILGVDAETFQTTKLGKYIMNRVTREESRAIEELIACDPRDEKPNVEIRDEIFRLRSIPMFIQDAIQEGRVAIQNMEVMEAYDHEDNSQGEYHE